jgi:hypothetical protein
MEMSKDFRSVLAVSALLAGFLALLAGFRYTVPLNGDDVHIMQADLWHYLNVYNYFNSTAARANLGLMYMVIHRAAGTMEDGTGIYVVLFAASAGMCYLYFSRLYGSGVAGIASLLYVFWASKYEAITWYSAGLYLAVWAIWFAMLWLLASPSNGLWKPVAAALLFSLSLHIYEALTVVMPALVLAFVAIDWRRLGQIRWTYAALSCLPAVALAWQVWLLASYPFPIYDRYKADPLSQKPMMELMANAFSNALSATAGPDHWQQVSWAFAEPLAPLPFLILLAISIILALMAWWTNEQDEKPPPAFTFEHGVHLAVGACTFLFAGVISYITGYALTPSRLTGLPAIGAIMTLIGLVELFRRSGLAFLRSKAWRAAGTGAAAILLGTVAAVEAVTLKTILQNANDIADRDHHVTAQIVRWVPNYDGKMPVFIHQPADTLTGTNLWLPSRYVHGSGGVNLINAHGLPLKKFNPRQYRVFGVNSAWWGQCLKDLDVELKNGPVLMFTVDEHGKVLLVKDLRVTASDGSLLRDIALGPEGIVLDIRLPHPLP